MSFSSGQTKLSVTNMGVHRARFHCTGLPNLAPVHVFLIQLIPFDDRLNGLLLALVTSPTKMPSRL